MKKSLFVALLLLLFSIWGQAVSAGEWTTPEDFEKAQTEAEQALKRSGPTGPRHIAIETSSVGVVKTIEEVSGLKENTESQSKNIESNIVSVDQAMTDLHAKIIKQSIVIELASDVLFDFDKFAVKPKAAATLAKVAAIIREKARGNVLIEGHTDSKGSEAYNQALSEKRAMAVKNWLITVHGIKPDILKVKGWGELKPVAPNKNEDGSDNPEGRARNRRVVITIMMEK